MTLPLAYDVHGDGPLLVLVHGITEDRRSWDPLLDDLASDHRVVRVDLRGHGSSPAAAGYSLAEYADDIAALPAVDEAPLVIGHSLGGAVATAYAAAHDAIGVINVDQSLDLSGLQAHVQAGAPMLRGEQFSEAIYGLFDSMRGEASDDEWRRLTELRRPRQDVVLGTWAMMLDLDHATLEAAIDEMTAQVHVPYLALDGIDPGEGHREWLAERIPQAQLEIWAGAGHYPHLVDPQRFLSRVREFERTIRG